MSGIAEFLLVVMAFFVCLSLFSHGLKTGWSGGGGVIIEGGLIIGIWTCRWLVGFVQGSPIRNPWFKKSPPGEGGVINEGGLNNQSYGLPTQKTRDSNHVCDNVGDSDDADDNLEIIRVKLGIIENTSALIRSALQPQVYICMNCLSRCLILSVIHICLCICVCM